MENKAENISNSAAILDIKERDSLQWLFKIFIYWSYYIGFCWRLIIVFNWNNYKTKDIYIMPLNFRRRKFDWWSRKENIQGWFENWMLGICLTLMTKNYGSNSQYARANIPKNNYSSIVIWDTKHLLKKLVEAISDFHE